MDRVAGPDRARKVDTLEGHGTGSQPPGQPVGSARTAFCSATTIGTRHSTAPITEPRATAEAYNDSWSETTWFSRIPATMAASRAKTERTFSRVKRRWIPAPARRSAGSQPREQGGLDTAGRADIVHLPGGTPRATSSEAIARPGTTWPAVPPPAMIAWACWPQCPDGRRSSARPSRRGSPPSKSHQTTGTAGSHP